MSEPGELRVENDLRGLRFERRYDAPPSEVWASLTNPERLARWFAQTEIDLRIGGHDAHPRSPRAAQAVGGESRRRLARSSRRARRATGQGRGA